MQGSNYSDYGENVGRYRAQCSRLGDQVRVMCEPLTKGVLELRI